jgi:hypothetical protein
MEALDASPPAAGRRAPLTSRTRIERSCILCHRRKVKCNKQLPCSTCIRSGVLCCYPPGEKHEIRKNRTTISDIINRLGQLERTIVAISSSDDQLRNHDSAQPVVESRSPDQDSATTTVSREGTLWDNGYSSRYVNDVLLSRVLEEVCFILFPVNERNWR